MLISHAEKTYDCNAESKFKVSETKHTKEKATKGKADTNSTQQCSHWTPNMGNFNNQNKKLSLAFKKIAAFQ